MLQDHEILKCVYHIDSTFDEKDKEKIIKFVIYTKYCNNVHKISIAKKIKKKSNSDLQCTIKFPIDYNDIVFSKYKEYSEIKLEKLKIHSLSISKNRCVLELPDLTFNIVNTIDNILDISYTNWFF
jgi:hypothetical protein